jgi:hypothetical protein
MSATTPQSSLLEDDSAVPDFSAAEVAAAEHLMTFLNDFVCIGASLPLQRRAEAVAPSETEIAPLRRRPGTNRWGERSLVGLMLDELRTLQTGRPAKLEGNGT